MQYEVDIGAIYMAYNLIDVLNIKDDCSFVLSCVISRESAVTAKKHFVLN